MANATACSIYRGGTSKGLYFLAEDLPADETARDNFLLAALGSPDTRQIDGMGGAHPLTSKVAIVKKSERQGIDIDYLFLQVVVDKAEVSGAQNCGNILAGVGPFAIDKGLVDIRGSETDVRIFLENTDSIAVARIQTPNNSVDYSGDTKIDGVPGSAAPISIQFEGMEGSSCGALFPAGFQASIDGMNLTCIDNGMPVVVMNAADFGLNGEESPQVLEADSELKSKIEAIRLQAGTMMNLGDVKDKTVPKMCLASPARQGGLINTRTFIPHRVHEAIGVLGAVSVATACLIPGTVVHGIAAEPAAGDQASHQYAVEHPSGSFAVEMQLDLSSSSEASVQRAAIIRTARLLMRGEVFTP
jgi:4-oxalomesaconate tautomerase